MEQNKNNAPRRVLTVIEGREENSHMVEGFSSSAKKRGWGFCQILGINSDKLARFDFEGIPLDYVIFRELSVNNYHEAERLMYWLKNNHKTCINADVAGRRMSTSDKHFQQGLFMMDPFLKEYALPTYESRHKKNVLSYVYTGRVHYPFILKDRRGTAGKNIILIKSPSDLDEVEDFEGLLIEQYIEPECDYRVFVIGGVAVGTMRKKGDLDNPGDFVAWSAGREKHPENDPAVLEQLADIATRAASVSKLEYAGVDIIREKGTNKLYLLETNIAAGWPNFVPVTGINIPDLVLDWFEDIDEGKTMSLPESIEKYISARKQYLPQKIVESYNRILSGDKEAISPYRDIFAKYDNRYLCDAGHLFNKLKSAYLELLTSPKPKENYAHLISTIESIPLSWAGQYIGPDVGTLHDGAILSALYLFILHKIQKM